MSGYQAHIVETVTGAPVDRVAVSEFPWARALSAGASGTSCKIPLAEMSEYSKADLDDLVQHWSRTVVLEHDGAPVFSGIIRDHDWDDQTLKLVLTDLWGLWARRGAWDRDAPNVEDWSVSYENLSLGTLAKRAVQRGTTGAGSPPLALPIALPADVAGTVPKRTYYGYHLEYVADVLDDLALEGVKIDFPPRWQDGMHEWQMVTDPVPELWEWHVNADDGGVTGFRRHADGAKMTNNAIFVGEGSEADMLVRSQRNLASTLPRLDRIESRKYVTDVAQLQALAHEGAVVYGPATDQWSFEIMASGNPDAGIPAVEELSLNDTVRLWFSGDDRIPDGYYDRRIVKIQGSLGEKVTITCQATVASGGIDHADARQELDRLQRRVKALETASPMNHTSVTYSNPDFPEFTYTGSGLLGIGIDVVQAISRSAYDALGTPNPTTLYAIDESS